MLTGLSRALAPALAVLAFAYACPAWADPTAGEKENAHRLMAEGRERREAKDLKTALQSFQAADSIMHVPTTGLEVARTEVALGMLVEAQEKLATVIHLPKAPRESKPFGEARAAAAALADELSAKVPSIKIVVRGVPEGAQAKVAIDGVNVPLDSLTDPRPVNPGHHVVVARIVNGPRREASVDVPVGTVQEIILALPEPPPPAARPAATPVTASTPDSPEKPPPSRNYTLTIVGFSFAGAALAAGGVTGILAMSKLSAAKSSGCVNDQCPPSAYPDLNASRTMATVSTVGFIAAGAGAALGVVGVIVATRGGSKEEATPSSSSSGLHVVPWVGFGGAGVSGVF